MKTFDHIDERGNRLTVVGEFISVNDQVGSLPRTGTQAIELTATILENTGNNEYTVAPGEDVLPRTFVRIHVSELYGSVWAEPERVFSMPINSHAARVLCTAGCGRTLGGEKVALVPIAQSGTDRRTTGWTNGLAVLLHVSCLPPQPAPAWVAVLRRAQELAHRATTGPENPEDVDEAHRELQKALALARLHSGLPADVPGSDT